MEEVQKSCAHLILQLGPGCTAPPPTPVRRAEPPTMADPVSSADDPSWSSASGLRPAFRSAVEDVDDNGTRCSSSSGIMCRNSSSPPSRTELDELALYLMQQSLFSTPTLLASPSSRRHKQEASPGHAAGASEGGTHQSSGSQQEIQPLVVCDQPSTYSFSMEGFCEESKADIRMVCEQVGTFHVQITGIDAASLIKVDQLCEQWPSMNMMCLIGSCPLIPISELMVATHSQETNITPSCVQDDGTFSLSLELPVLLQDAPAVEAATDSDLREAMRMLASLLVEISKELLKFLMEDICHETRNNLRGHFLKPLLYTREYNSDQEPLVSRHDEDVVLSIICNGNANHQGLNEKQPLLAILGSQIQTWSTGKLKAPTLLSLCNLVDKGVCIQFDLVYHP